MRFYTVHTRPDVARTDPLATVFVKEGFSWFALVSPVLWAIYHRLWLVLLGVILATFAVGALAEAAGQGEPGAALATFLLHLLIAFEANDLRRWTLTRNGHHLVAVAAGATLDDAERNFFLHDLPGPDIPDQPAAPGAGGRIWPKPRPDPGGAGDVLGLFPRPGA